MSTGRPDGHPRRIAFVCGSFNGGGTEQFLVRILRTLDRARFEPYVVVLDDTGPLRDDVHRLAAVIPIHLTGKLFNRQGVRELFRLRRILRTSKVELVHVLIERATVYGAFAARLAGIPVVASQRNMRTTMDRVLNYLYLFTFRHFVRHIITNSRAIVTWLEDQKIHNAPFTVIYNGIPASRLLPVVERNNPEGPIVVCAVARLMTAIKGQHLLIDAVSRLVSARYDLRLVLVGSGPDETALRALAIERGIADRIEFAGYLADPTEILEASDICVLSSYMEGFPNAVVEYLAAGRPTIATAVGGVPEMIHPEETGLLIPPGDNDALAAAIARLAGDPDLRRRLGRAGRALVERELTAEREAERTMEVYDRVLAE